MPQCYGTFTFTPKGYKGVPSYKSLPWDSLLCLDELVDCLLIEYLPWQPISYRNVTLAAANNAMEGFKIIQSAGIIHQDLGPEHILLGPDDHVAFVCISRQLVNGMGYTRLLTSSL